MHLWATRAILGLTMAATSLAAPAKWTDRNEYDLVLTLRAE